MHNTRKYVALSLCAAILAMAPQARAVEWTQVVYMEVITDHALPQTGFLYDANFNVHPTACWSTSTSAIAYPNTTYLRGVSFRMVARTQAGVVIDVSDNPAYTEMNHHTVLGVRWDGGDGLCSSPPGGDDIFAFPIAAGSELTDFMLPAGYGFDITGGELGGSAWHWHNASHMHTHGQRVFIEMTLTLSDDNLTPTVNVWIGENFALCIPPGVSCTQSPMAGPFNANGRIVLAVPHIHDHADTMQLWLRTPTGDVLMHDAPIANSLVHPVAHDECAILPQTNFVCGTPSGPSQEQHWHVHGSGNGHLPVGGLRPWTPGPSQGLIGPNDQLYSYAEFDNPHSSTIDNMVIFFIFAEALP